jgi:indole-3-glycerol phosphate synthase
VWTAPTGVLGRLTQKAFERASLSPVVVDELRARTRDLPAASSFGAAIRNATGVAVIAEVKRKSPSRGALSPGLSAADRAESYVAGGAVALSILTEESEFGGSLTDLAEVRTRVGVPLLRKDFHVHESQVWEARIAGASALLLIARALEPALLEYLCGATIDAGLEPLIEVRSAKELDLAIHLRAPLIGVNARNLETLVIDAAVVAELLPSVPRDRVAVAESGIQGVDDVTRVARQGADAVLVGSMLSLAPDGADAVRGLIGMARHGRAS